MRENLRQEMLDLQHQPYSLEGDKEVKESIRQLMKK